MKIIGLGNDLVDIRRIEKSLNRFNNRFMKRVFTETEIAYCQMAGNVNANFAKRFAAKEACAKALGTGIAGGVCWKDMGVVNDQFGKPTMQLTGGAMEKLNKLLMPGMRPQIDLAITDEFPMAQAIVIISAVSDKQ